MALTFKAFFVVLDASKSSKSSQKKGGSETEAAMESKKEAK